MIASKTVFIDADGKLLAEGKAGKDPKRKLAQAGQPISAADLAKHPDLEKLAGATEEDALSMTSSQTIFIDRDGNAIAEGAPGPDPKTRLVNAGEEIAFAKLDQHPGSRELAEGKGKKKEAAKTEAIETREPKVEHRDPHHVVSHKKK